MIVAVSDVLRYLSSVFFDYKKVSIMLFAASYFVLLFNAVTPSITTHSDLVEYIQEVDMQYYFYGPEVIINGTEYYCGAFYPENLDKVFYGSDLVKKELDRVCDKISHSTDFKRIGTVPTEYMLTLEEKRARRDYIESNMSSSERAKHDALVAKRKKVYIELEE